MEDRLKKLSILTDYLISELPSCEGKENIISWLKSSPYSPYVTLYGGVNSLEFKEEDSFVSSLDNKRRYLLKDNFSFKLENFINHDNSIYSANTRLYDVINTDNLFNAYPMFKDIEISINISNSNNGNYSGSTYHKDNIPERIEVFADNNENGMRVLLHELQHCVQLREGFEIGQSYYQNVSDSSISSTAAERAISNMLVSLKEEELTYQEKEIYDVYLGRKEKITLKIKDISEILDFIQGSRKEGARKILSFHGDIAGTGGLTPKEMVQISYMIANAEIIDDKSFVLNEERGWLRYRYDLEIKGTNFGILIEENNYAKKIIDYYSNRNYIDYGNKKYHKKGGESITKQQSCSLLPLDNILSENNVNVKIKNEENIGFDIKTSSTSVELLDNDSNTRSLPSPNEPIEKILPNKKQHVDIISKEKREENFKEWFGDSKVVDSNGEPLVVYHGTNDEFDEFKGDRFWFSEDAEIAKSFGEKLIKAYVSIKNPLNIRDTESKKNILLEIHSDMYYNSINIINELKNKYSDVYFGDLKYWHNGVPKEVRNYLKDKSFEDYEKINSAHDFIIGIEYGLDSFIYGSWDEIIALVKEKGYDGLLTIEEASSPKLGLGASEGVVVFNPSQIKSIHNKGTFDINNPNILEKNDYGLRHIEKVLSILPDNIKTSTVKNYLMFNGISHEHLRGSVYQNCLNNETFINPIKVDKSNLDFESNYYTSPGEKESREIEQLYLTGTYDEYIVNMECEKMDDLLSRKEKVGGDFKIG